MEQQTGSKQEKECVKAVYCHPAYSTSMQSTHTSILAFKIPWTKESGGLQFTASQRVGHELVTTKQFHYDFIFH